MRPFNIVIQQLPLKQHIHSCYRTYSTQIWYHDLSNRFNIEHRYA